MNQYPIEINDDEIDIGRIFTHLRNHLFSILLITLLVLSLSITYAHFLKDVYTSNVSIAFSDEKTDEIRAIIPNKSNNISPAEKKLEPVKLTLETRKFISSAIQDLDISQRYYSEHNYKKTALYSFPNLKINLQIHDESYQELHGKTLYKSFFKITPINSKSFLLTIDDLEYNKVHEYNKTIHEKYFALSTTKDGLLSKNNYYVTKTNPSLLVDEILNNLTTSILSENILNIQYTDSVAQRAKEIVEEIAKKFRIYTLKKKTNEISQTLNFVNKEIKDIESILKGQGKALKDYQTKSDSFLTMESSNISLFKTITEKEELIKNLKLQKNELKSFRNTLKDGKFNTISLLNSGIQINSIQSLIELFRADEVELNEMKLQKQNIKKSITKNTQLTQLINDLNIQEKLLNELHFNFTEGHPEVKKATRDFIESQDNIINYIEIHIQRLQKNRYLTKEKILHNIVMTEKNIQNKLTMLKKDLRSEEKFLQTLPKKSLDIQELKRKFTLSENIYTFLLQKKMEMEISLSSTIANTQIIENARESLGTTKPTRKIIILIGFILGLILALIYTFLKVISDTKIRDLATINTLTDIPVYGSLPNKKNQRFFDEAHRAIRTNLQFVQNSKKPCSTILISSSVANEGKTTIVAGLANMLSKTGKKVLMMDLDLRKPRLYQEVDKSNARGMSHYLLSDWELSGSIQKVNQNLDFFPAGDVPLNPSELLMSEKFDQTIKILLEQYDYIVFDTPPIGSVIDANLLLQHSDIVLLVIRANISKRQFIEKFNHLKNDRNIESVGIILNDLKPNQIDDHSYGYGYTYS